MTNEQILWVGDHTDIFVNSRAVNEEQRDYIYEIYNNITGEQKKPNGCGRCWRNTKARVYQEYLKKVRII